MSEKRQDYLSWDEYYMSAAFLAAKRSKDPVTQVGACIVDKNKVIVGLGYNGMPKGCDDDKFPWGKDSANRYENKYFYVCHAEVNAILNKNCSSVEGCTMYVGLFPCNECSKFIIQSGIKEIVYMSDKHAHKDATKASKRMLEAAEIKWRQFIPNKKVVIDFDEINAKTTSQLQATPHKLNGPESPQVECKAVSNLKQ